jgi:hypothetical protein
VDGVVPSDSWVTRWTQYCDTHIFDSDPNKRISFRVPRTMEQQRAGASVEDVAVFYMRFEEIMALRPRAVRDCVAWFFHWKF